MTTRYHFSTIDSTNSWAKRNISIFDPNEITLITADEQTAGRGRYAKSWHSPPNENIYATFVFFQEKEIDQAFLVQLLATAAQKTLFRHGVGATIKWPNDLLVDGKKIAGILLEVVNNTAIVMGIGLNVNMPQETLAQVGQPATSLLVETGSLHNCTEIVNILLDDLKGRI